LVTAVQLYQYTCRIDGEHNNGVVRYMIKELKKEYPCIQQIRGASAIAPYALLSEILADGCRTYKKTLQNKAKEKPASKTKKMRIRSRQQRV